MTIAIKPTASGSTIEQDGSTVLSIESDRSVDIDSGTLHVDATNNLVGIGTSSPSYTLDVTSATSSAAKFTTGAVSSIIYNATGSGTSYWGDPTVGNSFAVNAGSNYVSAWTNNVERMRIDSGGYVFFGGTTTTEDDHSHFEPNGVLVIDRAAANGRTGIQFVNGSTNCGAIILNLASTQYLTSSDYRLKENVAPMSDSIDRLKQLKPSTWSWTQDGSHGEGFLAHEAQTVVPEAVHGTKDAVDNEGNPVYQGIDQAKLVPLLTAALQEAITKIEDLETRIQALESV